MGIEVPKKMTAILTREHDEPDVMQLSSTTTPVPGAYEVLVQVAAAGIKRLDVMQRQGIYPPPPGAPDILGLEIAGAIVALGEEVTESRIGDQDCALVAGGGYAEYCIASSSLCMRVPQSHGHGFCSGIGTTAIQLAKQFGASVFVTAGVKFIITLPTS